MKCISCLKDGKTGECYDIKDKTARKDIAEIKENIKEISGVEGNLVSETDLEILENNFNDSLNELNPSIDFAESERQKSKNFYDYATLQRLGKRNYYMEVNMGASIGVSATTRDSNGIACWIEQFDENKKSLKSSNYWTTKFVLQLEPTTKYIRVDNIVDYSQFMICYANSVEEIGDFQPYNGAIVHEKDIADVEHIETIYNKSSSDSNINKGLTSGIPFDDTTELSLGENLSSKYKGVYAYITIWNVQVRCYCDISYGQKAYAFTGSDPNHTSQSIVSGRITIDKTTGVLKGQSLIRANLGSGDGYTSLTDSKYNIYKVEGVLK